MNKRLILGTAIVALAALLLLAGCGGGEDTDTKAESAAEAAPEAAPATEASEAATVASHDCAGGCGMKDWPEDQMTEIEGKWYCAGCAKKVQAESEEKEHGDG
jgi:hypothetical protein